MSIQLALELGGMYKKAGRCSSNVVGSCTSSRLYLLMVFFVFFVHSFMLFPLVPTVGRETVVCSFDGAVTFSHLFCRELHETFVFIVKYL